MSQNKPVATNFQESKDTWQSWEFYRANRATFGRWDSVELKFGKSHAPDRVEPSPVLHFLDDAGQLLELYGVNFGYEGGTPYEVATVLVEEGFPKSIVESVVFNRSEAVKYPQTIRRTGNQH